MFSKLRFSGFIKNCHQVSFGEPQLRPMSLNFKTSCCNLKIKRLGKNVLWLFHYFNFERSYDVLKAKSPCILLNKKKNLKNPETESKMENPIQSFRETNLVLQLISESPIKSKTKMSGSSRKKNEGIFVPSILSKENFLKIFVLSHCIVF